MRAVSSVEERVLAPWVERIGLIAAGLSALLMITVLTGEIAMLEFDYVPSATQLRVLQVGPVVALALATVGNLATWYHRVRLVLRFALRREKPDVQRETWDIIEDEALDVPEKLDSAVRASASRRRGCQAFFQGCQMVFVALIFVASAAMAVATDGPTPLRAFAVVSRGGQRPATATAMTTTAKAEPTGGSLGGFPTPTPTSEVQPATTPTLVAQPTSRVTEYALPTTGGAASGITAGPDGALWFTEVDGNRIGRIRVCLTNHPAASFRGTPR